MAMAPAAACPSAVAVALLTGVLLLGCSRAVNVAGAASDGLVFVRQTPSGTDLFRARLSDGAIERLTRTPGRNEDWPDWSDRAGRLAFLSGPAGGSPTWDLLVWSAARRDQAAVFVQGRSEYFLDWSPAAPLLAYSHRTGAGDFVVAQIDVANGTRQQLASASGGAFLARPSFSFDGRRLVAQRIEGGLSQLLILAPGEPPRRVLETSAYDDHGRFTRDDAWIAFDRRSSRHAPADLMLVRPDGSETRNLTNSPDLDEHSPRVSPVRDELTFVSDRSGTNDVYVVGYPGGEARNLTHTPDTSEWMPQFSPDGERIVFVILPAGFRADRDRLDYGTARIAVVDREGRRLFETDGIDPDWMPAWE